MLEQNEYLANNISVYFYRGKMIKMGRNFHIVVDNNDEYYVNVVLSNGLNIVNRSQLKGLNSISFLEFVDNYNLICEKNKRYDDIQETKDSYTTEELVMFNKKMGSLFNWPNLETSIETNGKKFVKVRK